jgi:GNAT superfamily N-acetyltransferase
MRTLDEPEEGRAVSGIRIDKVETKKALKKFIKFPWTVYKGDPNWVPPLILDVKERLDRNKNPFFEHAEMDLFLAFKDGALAGRIAAIIDDNHNQVHNEKVAFFGMYESLDDIEVAKALLDQVAAWGLERGMEILRGPMNLSMNDECAFLLEGFDSPPVVMMSYNPPYYLDLMEQAGLSKVKDLYAFYMNKDHATAQKVEAIVKRVERSSTIKLRTVNPKTLKEDVEKIRYVYNHGWERNWGFVPWTDHELDHMADNMKQLADWDIVILAEDKGKPVGFAFGLPNYNEALIKMNGRLLPFGLLKLLYYKRRITGIRAVVFGILKEYRMTGLSYMLYWHLEKNSLAKGYTWAETSWQLEDNDAVNRFVSSIGGEIYKKYRFYGRKISG